MNVERGFKPLDGEKAKEAELRIDPRYRIFFKLQDTFGGSSIAEPLISGIQEGTIKRVIWLGPPGAGKTTCRLQSQSFIQNEIGGANVRPVLYDDVLASTTGELGKNDEIWDAADWRVFSRNYREQLARTSDDEIVCAEGVAIGEPERDRGRAALIDLCNDPEEAKQTAMFVLVPDRTISENARELRHAVLRAEPAEVLDVLSDRQIKITGKPRTTTHRQKEKVGERLQSVYAKMATPEWMQRIDEEINQAVLINNPSARRIVDRIRFLEEGLGQGQNEGKMADLVYDLTMRELGYLYMHRDSIYMTQVSARYHCAQSKSVYNKYRRGEIVFLPWKYFVGGQTA